MAQNFGYGSGMNPEQGQPAGNEMNVSGRVPRQQQGFQEFQGYYQYGHPGFSHGQAMGQSSGLTSQQQQYQQYVMQQQHMQQQQMQQQQAMLERKRKLEEEERQRQQEAMKQRDFELQRMRLQAMGSRDKTSGKANLDDMFGKALTGLGVSSSTRQWQNPTGNSREFSDFKQASPVVGQQGSQAVSHGNVPVVESKVAPTVTPQSASASQSVTKTSPKLHSYDNLLQDSLGSMGGYQSQGRRDFTPPVVAKFEAKPYTQTYTQSNKARSWGETSEDFSSLFKVKAPQQQPTQDQMDDFQPFLSAASQPAVSLPQGMPPPSGSQPQGTQPHMNTATAQTQQQARIPSWCLPSSPLVPPLYQQVFKQCKDATGIHVDTNLVFPVLLSSGLSRTVLKAIWATANKMTPGKLNRIELYIALGLVGLAQAGCTDLRVAVLAACAEPVVPQLHSIQLPETEEDKGQDPTAIPPVQQDLMGGFENSNTEVVTGTVADTQVLQAAQTFPVQQAAAKVNPDAQMEINAADDRYGVFRSLSDPRANEATATVQSLPPSVSADLQPTDPSDKYSIFRSIEVSNPSVSNVPLTFSMGSEVSAASVNTNADSQAGGAPCPVAGSGSLTSMVGVPNVSVEQRPVDHDFGAFSDFQSAPATSMALSQPHAGGGFADFQSAAISAMPISQSQSQLPSDPFQSTFRSIEEIPTQTLGSQYGDFSAFQSTVPVETSQLQVSFTNTDQVVAPAVELVVPSQTCATGDVQSSHETLPSSVHQARPPSSDFSDFQMANTSPSPPVSDNSNSHGSSIPAADTECSLQSDVSSRKTLLALAMDSRRDESPGPFVVVTKDSLAVEEPAKNKQSSEIDLLGGDIPLAVPVTPPTSEPTTKDDSFGEFSGADVTSSEPEVGFLSLEPAVSSKNAVAVAAGFSATSSASSLSKMNLTSSSWSDLASLADLGPSTKPISSPKSGGVGTFSSSVFAGENETKLSDNVPLSQPGHDMNVSQIETVNWTSGDQTIVHPQPVVFGGRYDLTNSAEAETSLHEQAWSKCVRYCFEDVQKACDILKQVPNQQVLGEVLNSKEGRAYFLAVIEVYRVARRIQAAAPELPGLQVHFNDLKSKWDVLVLFLRDTDLEPSAASLDFTDLILSTSDRSTESACGVCLLNVAKPRQKGLDGQANSNRLSTYNKAILSYGGRRYCACCANYWCNRVDSVLPALPLFNPLL